jgi:hypothetical protein
MHLDLTMPVSLFSLKSLFYETDAINDSKRRGYKEEAEATGSNWP